MVPPSNTLGLSQSYHAEITLLKRIGPARLSVPPFFIILIQILAPRAQRVPPFIPAGSSMGRRSCSPSPSRPSVAVRLPSLIAE
jgi:hypothetical protein